MVLLLFSRSYYSPFLASKFINGFAGLSASGQIDLPRSGKFQAVFSNEAVLKKTAPPPTITGDTRRKNLTNYFCEKNRACSLPTANDGGILLEYKKKRRRAGFFVNVEKPVKLIYE